MAKNTQGAVSATVKSLRCGSCILRNYSSICCDAVSFESVCGYVFISLCGENALMMAILSLWECLFGQNILVIHSNTIYLQADLTP